MRTFGSIMSCVQVYIGLTEILMKVKELFLNIRLKIKHIPSEVNMIITEFFLELYALVLWNEYTCLLMWTM
jgi:hypothetical protein